LLKANQHIKHGLAYFELQGTIMKKKLCAIEACLVR